TITSVSASQPSHACRSSSAAKSRVRLSTPLRARLYVPMSSQRRPSCTGRWTCATDRSRIGTFGRRPVPLQISQDCFKEPDRLGLRLVKFWIIGGIVRLVVGLQERLPEVAVLAD